MEKGLAFCSPDDTGKESDYCNITRNPDASTPTQQQPPLYQPLQRKQRSSDETYEGLTNPVATGEEYELLSVSKGHIQQQQQQQQHECESLSLSQEHNGSNPQCVKTKGADHDSTKLVKRIKFAVIVTVIFNIVLLLLVVTIAAVVVHDKIIAINHSSGTNNDNNMTSVLNQLDILQTNISYITEEFTAAYSNITSLQSQVISLMTHVKTQGSNLQLQVYCGPGEWRQVAYLNMSDSTQQCPSAWREYNTDGVRACGRPNASEGSIAAETYSVMFQYRRVCGRVVGYQYGSPDGFLLDIENINQVYVDGISITHGSPREHIWTYAGGLTETASINDVSNCPCSTSPGSIAPSFVGVNYCCESGNPTDTFAGQLYTNDKLWDGKQCEGSCCTGTGTPLWFSAQLNTTTSDDIEVRIFGNEQTSNEDTPVELIEMYVAL